MPKTTAVSTRSRIGVAIWRSGVKWNHGVTPTFHVADPPRAFADGWYADAREEFVSPFDSVMLSVPPALALTDLIINGVLARHPELEMDVVLEDRPFNGNRAKGGLINAGFHFISPFGMEG